MIQYGTITQFRYTTDKAGKKLEVKVSVDERVTDWLPVKTQASSFLRVHTPVRINDQVIVFNPFGNNENGFVDRNLTYKDIPLPDEADENSYVSVFEDGTTFIHNVESKEISLDTPCSISITTVKDVKLKTSTNVNIECATSNVKANQVNIDSSDINNGLGGTGVQTDESICNLTGLPCSNGSSTVKATM